MNQNDNGFNLKKSQFVDDILATVTSSGIGSENDLKENIGALVDGFLNLNADSHSSEVTILLSDIRGFTALSERYKAQEIVGTLNNYFAHMNEIILRYDGLIDKYMGDAIMVLFGAPESRPDDAHRAVACAVEMQIAMDQVNKESMAQGLPELFMGIGINTDTVSSGQIGSNLHSEYTVIGDGVNLASRVEAHSLRGQVLIGQSTFEKVRDIVEVGTLNEVQVKGKQQRISLHEITAIGGEWNLKVPQREIRKSARVEVNKEFEFQVISGKEVLPEALVGQLKDISYDGCFAVINTEIEPFTDIKFSLSLSLIGGKNRDIYAKIKSVRKFPEGYGCGIEFTSLDEESQQSIKDFIDTIIEGR
ncbi:MAG: adenylate cyclase [Rhodospirillaceae bacterium]|nr:adenylate cyclase [Rhodospirillaceae bacterium]MBT5808974.1 adenylate cyclase [Rhodospirillaceae bacterium]